MNEFDINLFSCKLGSPVGVSVYLPSPSPGEEPASFYESGEKYKVLWLLHAGNGDRNDWIWYTDLANLIKGRKVAIVCPDGLNSDFSNHPQFGEGYLFADYFFEELMPFIHHWLPISSEPKDQFLAGVSMGALAVWTLGLKEPGRFGGLAPFVAKPRNYFYLEPYREMNSYEFRKLATENRTLFPAGYGNAAAGIWPKEINMICKYPTVGEWLDSYEHTWNILERVVKAGELPPKLFLVGGEEDPRLQTMKAYVEELGITSVKYCTVPGMGGHGYAYWGQFLLPMLEYFEL